MDIPKKPRKQSNQQILIAKFIDPARFSDKNFWPREMKMATKLVKEYNLEFLLWVIPPYNRKVPSLAYFMADYGKQYLMEAFFNYKKETTDLSPKTVPIQLSQDKIGEDIQIEHQPKTLKDFLNMFQTPQTIVDTGETL